MEPSFPGLPNFLWEGAFSIRTQTASPGPGQPACDSSNCWSSVDPNTPQIHPHLGLSTSATNHLQFQDKEKAGGLNAGVF